MKLVFQSMSHKKANDLDAADRPLDLSLKKTGRRRNSVEHSVLNVHASLVPAHILPAQAESKSHMWK